MSEVDQLKEQLAEAEEQEFQAELEDRWEKEEELLEDGAIKDLLNEKYKELEEELREDGGEIHDLLNEKYKELEKELREEWKDR